MDIDLLALCFCLFFCSVAYVSRSGGMSNELNNIISLNTNGVYEGIAIGGDRYPGTTFMDHILRYQDDPKVKMIILLGEVKFCYCGIFLFLISLAVVFVLIVDLPF